MEFAVLGLKRFYSKKSDKNWAVVHVAYQDPQYELGYAVDSLIVDPAVLHGEFVEGCKVRIDRTPDGKRIIAITVV